MDFAAQRSSSSSDAQALAGAQGRRPAQPPHPPQHQLPAAAAAAGICRPITTISAENFPDIADAIKDAKRMVFHVVGDTGGVQDGEFQNNVAEQMIDASRPAARRKPQFCYHVGDVVYFTGDARRLLRAVLRALRALRCADLRPFPAITMARSTIRRRRPRSTAGSTISCRRIPMSIRFPRTRRAFSSICRTSIGR